MLCRIGKLMMSLSAGMQLSRIGLDLGWRYETPAKVIDINMRILCTCAYRMNLGSKPGFARVMVVRFCKV